MARLALCLILQEVGGPVDPGFGGGWGGVDHVGGGPIYHPGHPAHGLPSQPGHPANRPPGSGGPGHVGGGPIYHPGHPDHGLPSGGHIGNQLPWAPGHPDAGLPVPPGVTPPPAPGGALKDKLVVLWHIPGQTAWHGKVMDPSLEEGNELPETPEPK